MGLTSLGAYSTAYTVQNLIPYVQLPHGGPDLPEAYLHSVILFTTLNEYNK